MLFPTASSANSSAIFSLVRKTVDRSLATLEVVRGSVGFEVHRIVHPLVRLQAGDAHHPALSLANCFSQPLSAGVSCSLALLGVAMLVYSPEHALPIRCGRGLFEHELKATLLYSAAPTSIPRENTLKALCLLVLRSPQGLGIR